MSLDSRAVVRWASGLLGGAGLARKKKREGFAVLHSEELVLGPYRGVCCPVQCGVTSWTERIYYNSDFL